AVDGYENEIVPDEENPLDFTITNTHVPELIKIEGSKIWEDDNNRDGIRPESYTVNLLANGTEVAEQDVTAEDNWEYVFTDLPKYEAGEEIVYTVTENTVENYTQDIDGYDITNYYTPGETGVTVTKAWDDGNNQDGNRPES